MALINVAKMQYSMRYAMDYLTIDHSCIVSAYLDESIEAATVYKLHRANPCYFSLVNYIKVWCVDG